jgi:hypothetical protein
MKTKTIWKYEFEISDRQEIRMPNGAEILSVQVQQSTFRPCMWVLVDPAASDGTVTRRFRVFGTGHPIEAGAINSSSVVKMAGDLNYIGTFQVAGKSLVFHLFEEAR